MAEKAELGGVVWDGSVSQRAKWDRPGAEGVPQSLFLELGSWGDFLAQILQENLPSRLWCNCASSKKQSFAV